MKIRVCDRCRKELERWEGVKIKITEFYDNSIMKAHLCDKCFEDYKNFYYRKGKKDE